MEEEKIVTCMYTGEVIEGEPVPIYTINHYGCLEVKGYATEEAAKENAVLCRDCGKYFEYDSDVVTVHTSGDDSYILCGSCLEYSTGSGDVARCDECMEYFETRYMHLDDWGNAICHDCYRRIPYCECQECGRLMPEDNAYGTADDECYCYTCYERGNPRNYINSYHYKPVPIFHSVPNKDNPNNDLFMGVELEVDRGDDVDSCSVALHEVDHEEKQFYQKHDGSLDEGIEIVTHPCTLNFHMQEFPWDKILNICLQKGFSSHNVSTCGLHVHVSRLAFGDTEDEQDLNIAKVLLLFDHFWDQIVTFSRRKYQSLERWAKKAPDKYYSDEKDEDVVKKMKRYQDNGDRYTAVNLCNEKTVEFRVFRGTLKKSTIMATLQFLYNLVDYVVHTKLIDVQGADWLDIVNRNHFDELSAYLDEKGLNVSVPITKIIRPKIKRATAFRNPVHDGIMDITCFTITEEPDDGSMDNTRVLGVVRNGHLDEILFNVVGLRRTDTEVGITIDNNIDVITVWHRFSDIAIIDFKNIPEMREMVPGFVEYNGYLRRVYSYQNPDDTYYSYIVSEDNGVEHRTYVTVNDITPVPFSMHNKMIHITRTTLGPCDEYGYLIETYGSMADVITAESENNVWRSLNINDCDIAFVPEEEQLQRFTEMKNKLDNMNVNQAYMYDTFRKFYRKYKPDEYCL